MMFHPDLLSKNADPEGSVRYGNVNICHEKIECKHEDTTFYDDIAKTNTFIIDDRSPQYKGYECSIFKEKYHLTDYQLCYIIWKNRKKHLVYNQRLIKYI